MNISDSPRVTNRILTKLPLAEYERISPHMELVSMPQGKVIYVPEDHIDFVYFPITGMISIVSYTEKGESVEVGMIGNEGMVGIPVILGIDLTAFQVEVQIASSGAKLDVNLLKDELPNCPRLQELLLRYAYTIIVQISQSAVCNRFHTIDERLCKWMLIARDRVKSNRFNLTQEALSQMMGTHRPNVSVAARFLRKAGIIYYRRGDITILDEERLKECACECYEVIRQKLEVL